MKKGKKIYLEESSWKRLNLKAEALGFFGRGKISHYFEKVSNTDIAFLDQNLKKVLSLLNLKQTRNSP